MLKNVQNLTPAYKSTLGRDLCLRAAGATFIQDAWQWQSVRRCADDAEMPPRLPATTRWWPVGGWSTGDGGELPSLLAGRRWRVHL